MFSGKGKFLYICVVEQISLNPSFTSSSFLCGLAGALASNPVDVVRTRMMNQKSQKHGGHSAYKGTLDCLLQVSSSCIIINRNCCHQAMILLWSSKFLCVPNNLDISFAIMLKRTMLSVMHSSVKSIYCLDRKAGKKCLLENLPTSFGCLDEERKALSSTLLLSFILSGWQEMIIS